MSCLVFFFCVYDEGGSTATDRCHRRTDRHASSAVRIDQVDDQGMCCTDSGTLRPASVALDAHTWKPQAAALEFSVLQVGHGTILYLRGIPESFSCGSFDVE